MTTIMNLPFDLLENKIFHLLVGQDLVNLSMLNREVFLRLYPIRILLRMHIKPIYMWPNLWIDKEDQLVKLIKQPFIDKLTSKITSIFKKNYSVYQLRKPILEEFASIEWIFPRLDISINCFKLLHEYLPNAKALGLSIKDKDDQSGLAEALKSDKVTCIYINNCSPLFLCNIQSMKRLASLGVVDITIEYADILARYLPLSYISELSITCENDSLFVGKLVQVLPSTRIKRLHVFNAELVEEIVSNLASGLPKSKVVELTIINHPSVQKELSVDLITKLSVGIANSKTTKFCFRGYNTTLEILFSLLSKSNLKELTCNIPKPGEIKALSSSIRYSKLKKISTGIPAEYLADFLKESCFSELEELELRYIGWITNGDQICEIISQNIQYCKFKRFILTRAQVSAGGLETLLSNIEDTRLEYLDLSANRIPAGYRLSKQLKSKAKIVL
ncbi:hypothetical protein HDV04_005753 [Boothiomyces sp. JEL0838]|nr:hypothetical protein HDV04_005753 [Boothiomyces sp. JEL0838]